VVDLGPNLAIIPKANQAYEDAIRDEKEAKFMDGLKNAHRYFLLDVVFFLYIDGREADANQWYRYLAQKYPDKRVLDDQPNMLPGTTAMTDYIYGRLEAEVQTLGQYKTRYMIEGLERQSLKSLADNDDDKAVQLNSLAQNIWNRYQEKIGNIGNAKATDRLPLAPLPQIRGDVLKQLLSGDLSPEETLILATKTGQTNLPPANSTPPQVR